MAQTIWYFLCSKAVQYYSCVYVGDICYLHVLGQGIVFLNSYEVAFDLLEKRGVIYSDRQRMVMAVEV